MCLNLSIHVPQLPGGFSPYDTVSSILAARWQQTATRWCFVLSLSLPCLFYSCFLPGLLSWNIPRKTPRDWLPLCSRAANWVCILLAAAELQPLGTEGGTASQEDEGGRWAQGEAHQEKNTKTMPGPETLQLDGGRGWGIPDPPSHTHPQSWLLQLPSLLSSHPLHNGHISITPKTASKMPVPREDIVSILASDESHLEGERIQAIWRGFWDLYNLNQWPSSFLFIVKKHCNDMKGHFIQRKKDYSWSPHPNTVIVFFLPSSLPAFGHMKEVCMQYNLCPLSHFHLT